MANEKTFIIQIPKPCHEGWNKMTQNEKGRFCDRCEKTVIDFSTKSDTAILQLIKKANGKVCGHFRMNQINREITEVIPSRNLVYPLPYILSGFLLLATPSCNYSKDSQVEELVTGDLAVYDPTMFEPEDTIKGRIVDAYSLEYLSTVKIGLYTDSNRIDSLITKEDGSFEFIIDKGTFNSNIQLKIEKSLFYFEQVFQIDPKKDIPWNQEIHLKTNFVDGEIMIIEKPSIRTKK